MIALIAQEETTSEAPGFFDNAWLDGFQFHFGEWIKQIVDWTDQNLQTPISIIEWPFQALFDLLMSDDPNRTAIMDIPWYWVAIFFFVIGSIARNTKVGTMAAVMVATCGLLGPDYWSETTKTFGMIFISVLLCAIIGIPLGILSGRVNGVWNVVRPTLDAMQVVHPFVFMLPFIFFWKIGEVSATMVTMVFALPPLVRLTNLGIRQVPEDVVEASRSYGASEPRVLFDVQLPLARPAIMTGLNQTLLLAISMLGIAAIMGAGGLGKLLLRAINSQNLPLAASGGLAFFLVAVVLDRITQKESDDGIGLLGRIREAFAYRANPEGLLAAQAERAAESEAAAVIEAEAKSLFGDERPAPVSSRERQGLLLAALGAAVAVVGVFLPWGRHAGLVSSWGRRFDEAGLRNENQIGWEATGGSVFAIAVLLLGLFVIAAALRPLFSFGKGLPNLFGRIQGLSFGALAAGAVLIWLLNLLGIGFGPLPTIGLLIFAVGALAILVDTWVQGSPRLGSDGAFIAGAGVFGAALGYILLQQSTFVEFYAHQIGAYLALAGGAVATIGGAIASMAAPYGSRRPFKLNISWPLVIGAVMGLIIVGIGSYSAWMVDQRLESLITPEMQAEIERLEAEAEGDINKQIANGQAITNMINSARAGDAPTYSGFDGDGPGLGIPTVILGLLSAAGIAVASGLFGGDERRRWLGGAMAMGFGLGAWLVPASWILSFTRSAEPAAITGAGSIIALIGGFILFAGGRSVVNEFVRRKVYSDSPIGSGVVDIDLGESGEIDVDLTTSGVG